MENKNWKFRACEEFLQREAKRYGVGNCDSFSDGEEEKPKLINKKEELNKERGENYKFYIDEDFNFVVAETQEELKKREKQLKEGW